jgi:hypothetical protein
MKAGPIALLALTFLVPPMAEADAVYAFSMNTSPLIGNGVFTLDFQFVDGTGLPADLNNNTVTLSNFAFGGGSPSGGGTATGGASGSLASGVVLTDAQFFNEYYENFTPGTTLAFTIDTTNVLNPSGTPDLFTVAILDSMGNELPTSGMADEFFDLTLIGGPSPQAAVFGSAPGSTFPLGPPAVQPQNTVPEPKTYCQLLAGLILLRAGARWIIGSANHD